MNDALAAALAAHRAGDVERAEHLYRSMLATAPHVATNLGALLCATGREAEGLELLRQASQLSPPNPRCYANLGNWLLRLGRLEDAVAAYREARALGFPAVNYNLSRALLALGSYEEGWTLYDARPNRASSGATAFPFPAWRGEPLAGKRLVIWPEQGFGDQIWAARYFQQLESAHLYCRPELARLFGRFGLEVTPFVGSTEVEVADYWTLPLSLPRWLPEPEPQPYLFGTATAVRGVGVVTAGNSLPDPGRSLPRELAARLLELPGSVDLAPEATGAADFQDTADIIAGLGLVVTIDTSVAHLAGAMGTPTWLLLQHHHNDWRWNPGPGRDSYWYPSIRIFRQPSPGDWASVIEAVEARWP